MDVFHQPLRRWFFDSLVRHGTQETGMDDVTFGLILMAVGMGGTLVTLMILSVLVTVLKRVCPLRPSEALKKAERP